MTPLVALSRVTHALLSMALLTFVIFGVTRITGDPVDLLLPENATKAQFAALHQQLGLNKPLIDQYGIFVGNLIHGNLGQSYSFGIPVTELIRQRFPATLQLALTAIVIVLLVGVPLGIYSAYWRGGWLDRFARVIAVIGQSSPAFWVGLLLIYLFAVRLHWVPSGGYGGFTNTVLPAVTLSLVPIAGLTRLIRSNMIEVLETDYVRFLRLTGVRERSILWKHGLRNAGLSTLSYTGLLFASLITSSTVVETVFNWPGLGQLISQGILGEDFAIVQGVVLLYSALYIVVNLIVDLLIGVLNPRLRSVRGA